MANCNISRWLVGLIPLALIAILFLIGEGPKIERDLAKRSAAALEQMGFYWAQVSFVGRDGILTGSASSPEERNDALNAVNAVSGVNSVMDKADLLPLIRPYTWSANHKDGSVRVKGHVPSDAERQIILGIVKANLPGMQVEDRMKLAAGAPPRQRWIGAISFALKQLSQLKRGNARVVDMELILVGEALDAAGYTAVNNALSATLPSGLSIKHFAITPARVKPYTWGVKKQNGTVTLLGYIPSEAARKELLEFVRKNFIGATIVDRMAFGSGVPKDWFATVFLAVGQVSRLEEGEAVLQDTDLTISGAAADTKTAETVTESLNKGLPDSYNGSNNIRVLKVPNHHEERPKAKPGGKAEKTFARPGNHSEPAVFLWSANRTRSAFKAGRVNQGIRPWARFHGARPEAWPVRGNAAVRNPE